MEYDYLFPHQSKSIAPETLEGFHCNDEELARKYAMDDRLIKKSGADVGLPKYEILGPAIDLTVPVELHVRSFYPCRLKVSALLREILSLSKNDIEQMIENKSIQITNGLDLKKCRVQTEVVLIIDNLRQKRTCISNLS